MSFIHMYVGMNMRIIGVAFKLMRVHFVRALFAPIEV